MKEKTIKRKLSKTENGDLVRVFYSKRPKIVKIKAGYAAHADVRGLYVFSEYGYNTYIKSLEPMGSRTIKTYIKREQILRLEILRRREEIRNDLERLLGTE